MQKCVALFTTETEYITVNEAIYWNDFSKYIRLKRECYLPFSLEVHWSKIPFNKTSCWKMIDAIDKNSY